MDCPGDEPEGGRRDVPGDPLVDCSHSNPSFDSPGHHRPGPIGQLAAHRHAPRPEHPLGVVPGRDRFPDRRAAVGPKPGQQDRRLHLGTRDGGRHVDRPKRGMAHHGQRREGVVPAGMEHRAHQAQWLDDTGHRAPPQRGIAIQHVVGGQAGQDPRRQAQGRAGIGAVQDALGLVQAVDPGRAHAIADSSAIVGQAFDGHPQVAQQRGRRADIGPVSGAFDPTLTLGQRREQERPVADRFVAGQAGRPAQAGRRPDGRRANGDREAGSCNSVGVSDVRGRLAQCLLAPPTLAVAAAGAAAS